MPNGIDFIVKIVCTLDKHVLTEQSNHVIYQAKVSLSSICIFIVDKCYFNELRNKNATYIFFMNAVSKRQFEHQQRSGT